MSHRKSSAGHFRQHRQSLSASGVVTSKKESALIFLLNHWEEKKKYQCTPIE